MDLRIIIMSWSTANSSVSWILSITSSLYQCASRCDEVNGKIHEMLVLTIGHNTAITYKPFGTFDINQLLKIIKNRNYVKELFFSVITVYLCTKKCVRI